MKTPSSLFFLRFLFVFTGIALVVVGGLFSGDVIPQNAYFGIFPETPDPNGVYWKLLNRAAGTGLIIGGLFILLTQVFLVYFRVRQFGRYVGLSLLFSAMGLILGSYFANQMIL